MGAVPASLKGLVESVLSVLNLPGAGDPGIPAAAVAGPDPGPPTQAQAQGQGGIWEEDLG